MLEEERWTYRQVGGCVNPPTRLTHSRSQVIDAAEALARELIASFHVTPGTTVAIAGRNTPQWVIAFIAITLCGAIVLPVNSWLSGEELRYILADASAIGVIADQPRLEAVDSSSSGRASFLQAQGMWAMHMNVSEPQLLKVRNVIAMA